MRRLRSGASWALLLAVTLFGVAAEPGPRAHASAPPKDSSDSPSAESTPVKERTPRKAAPSKWPSQITRTDVFGIEGRGSTFVYVFDRSGSMTEYQGRPLAAAKAELIKSLEVLRATHQFQIIFYNHEVTVFNPFRPQSPRMVFGTDQNKRAAEQFISQIHGAGGTNHLDALRLALGLGPDVIFFLTDATDPPFTQQQLDEVRRANRGSVLHTIEFGVGPTQASENFMVKLARQSGGQYVYIDVTQLPAR
jgi:hypothetical protein